ncbi:hypothetical protein DOTSEDRAFT_68879 [Dothistroma septosporum NZE10]|uniref:OsmC-like protein n=1 Tax=Dothistroma septosporum (strain NZE10 / CBS 128990) TaxID=675120 RepID=N1Q4D4_DOTSN|nr:hypothetical protein DOTSEDRAFT_68879 [Dothistroma septosporum NZE10]
MASIRTLRPALSSAPRLISINIPTKRFLNWSSSPPLTTAHATVTGGRQGHATTSHFELDLGMPKDLGGDGKKTNPEELFAAGYGACFQGAMAATAPSLGMKAPETTLVADVHLIGDAKKLDMGIRVDMKITGKGISAEDLKKLVEKTKTVCPYSRAVEGNVITNFEVKVE